VPTDGIACDGERRHRRFKFKAVNNRDKNFTRNKIDRRCAQLEESVLGYLRQLETADRQEPTEALATKSPHLKEKLAKLKEEMGKLEAHERRVLASPDAQISLTDRDSRSMATSGRGVWCCRLQCRRRHDASSDRDARGDEQRPGSIASLPGMVNKAKEVLGVDQLEAVADHVTTIASRSSPAPSRRLLAPAKAASQRSHAAKTQR
jgi:hypothetical protein